MSDIKPVKLASGREINTRYFLIFQQDIAAVALVLCSKNLMVIL